MGVEQRVSEIKVMNNDEIRDFCIKKDLKIFELEQKLQQKENIIKEAITYIEWLRNEHHKTENLGYTKAVYNTNELLVILHKLRGE